MHTARTQTQRQTHAACDFIVYPNDAMYCIGQTINRYTRVHLALDEVVFGLVADADEVALQGVDVHCFAGRPRI